MYFSMPKTTTATKPLDPALGKATNTLQPIANPGPSPTVTAPPLAGSLKDGQAKNPLGFLQGQKTGWGGATQPPGQNPLLNAMNSRRDNQGYVRLPVGMDPRNFHSGGHASTPAVGPQINWGKKDYGAWSGPGMYYHPVTGQPLGRGRENRYDWTNDPDGARGLYAGSGMGVSGGGAGGAGTSALSLLQALGAQRRTA